MFRSLQPRGRVDVNGVEAHQLLSMPGRVINDAQSMGKWVWRVDLGDSVAQLSLGTVRGKLCDNESSIKDNSDGLIESNQALDLLSQCGVLSKVHDSSQVEVTKATLNANFPTYHSEGIMEKYPCDACDPKIHVIMDQHDILYGYATELSERKYYAEATDGGNTATVCRQDFELSEVAQSGQGPALKQAEVCQYSVTPIPEEHNDEEGSTIPRQATLKIHELDLPYTTSLGVFEGNSHLGRPLFLCGPDFVYDDQVVDSNGNRYPYTPMGPKPPVELFGSGPFAFPNWKPRWWGRIDYFHSLGERFSLTCAQPPFEELKSGCGPLFIKIVSNSSKQLDQDIARFRGDFSYNEPPDFTTDLDIPWNKCYDDPEFGTKPLVYEEPTHITVLKLIGWVMLSFFIGGVGYSTYWYFEHYLPNKMIETNKVGTKRRSDDLRSSISNSSQPQKMAKAKKIPHAAYTPIYNTILNRMNKMGTCSICFDDEEKTFNITGCGHEVCKDCLRSYICTALGDASMFPIKCPMHHTGCLSVFEEKFSQRVLNKDEYERFLLFNDRAVYGDGMACIFCGQFVIFPERMGGVMVACPYCRQRFCMKCKIAWHVGYDCTNEGKDELEDWRKAAGATRCPGCFKVIEKDDAETCNHMVHKATDSIPCIQERTDFCYCCG